MPLSENERTQKIKEKYAFHSNLEPCKCDGCFLMNIINRLMAEREAIEKNLEAEATAYKGMFMESQSRLDAIEKAWEPIRADMVEDKHIQHSDTYMIDADELKALDGAIRRKG